MTIDDFNKLVDTIYKIAFVDGALWMGEDEHDKKIEKFMNNKIQERLRNFQAAGVRFKALDIEQYRELYEPEKVG